MDGQGNLERNQGKVREFENKGLWQSSNNYIFCSRGERMYFFIRYSRPTSLLIRGYS